MDAIAPKESGDETVAFLIDLLMETKAMRERAEALRLSMIAFLISMVESEARELLDRAQTK